MKSPSEAEYSVDPKIQELLDLLRDVPPRDLQAADRTKSRYFAEVNTIFDQDTRPSQHPVHHASPNSKSFGWLNFSYLQRKLAFTSLLAIIAVITILFGSAGVTAYASKSSLPGDALYPVKTGLELTRVSLARDAALQAQLYLSFAERRLDEISQLVAEGRFDDIDRATFEFETNVQQAIDTLNTVSAGDPAKAQELATQISNALSRYAIILKGILSAVPDTVKPAVEKAILKSETEGTGEMEILGLIEQITPDGWVIAGRLIKSSPYTEIEGQISLGAAVEVDVFVSEDGSLIAREIKVLNEDSSIDTLNSSANMRPGSNLGVDNVNENDNESEDQSNDQSNHNNNDNEEEDEEDDDGDSNSNRNRNDNEDENENEDDED